MPITTVEIQEIPARWEEVIASVKEGTEIIVTAGAVPCARLIPLPANLPPVPGLNAGGFVIADDFDAPLPADFWTDES
jgi:antitoxin (DNA-binding transcriptional repressor) of toxin-antitoxin stability system